MNELDERRTLKGRMDRLEARMGSIEAMIFQTNPSDASNVLDTLDAIREYLRKVQAPYLGPGAVHFIRERLPVDWRDMVKKHGHAVVFPLIAQNFNITDARRKLG